MFDLGAWGEIIIILAAALILLGPKDIPKIMKIVGKWVYKFRSLSQEVRGYVDELSFQAQREEIMKATKSEKKNPEAESKEESDVKS